MSEQDLGDPGPTLTWQIFAIPSARTYGMSPSLYCCFLAKGEDLFVQFGKPSIMVIFLLLEKKETISTFYPPPALTLH